jgi:hypothetical protein
MYWLVKSLYFSHPRIPDRSEGKNLHPCKRQLNITPPTNKK